MLFGIASEGLLFRSVPVLVESSLEFFTKVRSPDSSEGAKSTGSLDVSNNANDNDGGCLDNGDGFDDLAFVHLCRVR